MMTARRFRPDGEGLEVRDLPSHGPAPAAPPVVRGLGIPAIPPSDDPPPTNRLVPRDQWLAMHNSYAAHARRRNAQVVFLGDSILYGWGDSGRTATGSRSWDPRIAPFRAANFSINADAAADLEWRVRHGELAGRPRVAVVMIGVNDLFEGKTPADAVAGIAGVLAAIRSASPRTKVLVLGLLPVLSRPGDPNLEKVRQADDVLGPFAQQVGARYLDPSPAFLQDDRTLRPGAFEPDGIHPAPLGYDLLADAVVPALRELLGVRPQPRSRR